MPNEALMVDFEFKINAFIEEYAYISQRYDERNIAASKKLYEFVKDFLTRYRGQLSPDNKGKVLKMYVYTWEQLSCYIELEKNSIYASDYLSQRPMLIGFDLSAANLSRFVATDLCLFSVNLRGANFANSVFPYARCINTNFSGCDFTEANFNQAKFKRCVLNDVDLSQTALSNASFEYSDLRYSTLPPKDNGDMLWFFKCTIGEHHSSLWFFNTEDPSKKQERSAVCIQQKN